MVDTTFPLEFQLRQQRSFERYVFSYKIVVFDDVEFWIVRGDSRYRFRECL